MKWEIKLCVITVLLCCQIYELFCNNDWEHFFVKDDSALCCAYSLFISFQVEAFSLAKILVRAFWLSFVKGSSPVAGRSKAWV